MGQRWWICLRDFGPLASRETATQDYGQVAKNAKFFTGERSRPLKLSRTIPPLRPALPVWSDIEGILFVHPPDLAATRSVIFSPGGSGTRRLFRARQNEHQRSEQNCPAIRDLTDRSIR